MPRSAPKGIAPLHPRILYPRDMPQEQDMLPSPETDLPAQPSKSQRKRDAHALQAMGDQLVALPPAHLARLDLPDDLREAVRATRGIGARGARSRQLQYIGRLMRDVDDAVLQAVRQALEAWR